MRKFFSDRIEADQRGRLYIELINSAAFLAADGSPAEYRAGLERAIAGWHQSCRAK